MHRLFQFSLLAGLLLSGPMEVQAIAVANLAVAELPPVNAGSSFNWDSIYNYKGASATAVDHYWILTAAHVADDGGTGNLVINGETYFQQEVVLHSQAADPDGNPTADIALVRYDKPLPGYYLLADSVPVGSEFVVCGFGFPGSVFTSFFTENNTAGHTTKRWGTNKIGSERTYSSTEPIVATSKGFDISFSRNGTTYEAGCNIYDSGGGMFVNFGGVWKLTGHMVNREGANHFTGNFAVATTYYVNWIKSVITDYDTDMDGLPDWWEALYGATEAGDDLDGDGATNYEEWIADTDPTNTASFFQILDGQMPTNLVFDSSAERQYKIEYRLDLVDTNEAWQTEVDWFTGSGSQTATAVSSTTSNRLYRIRAKLY